MKKLLLILLLLPQIAFAQTDKMKVLYARVVDGDTLHIDDISVPKDFQPKSFRVYGIDTPETHKNKAKCKKEIELGLKAKEFTEKFIKFSPDNFIFIEFIDTPKKDPYGRPIIEVLNNKGQSLSNELIKAGLAVEYYGEKKSKDWCK